MAWLVTQQVTSEPEIHLRTPEFVAESFFLSRLSRLAIYSDLWFSAQRPALGTGDPVESLIIVSYRYIIV